VDEPRNLYRSGTRVMSAVTLLLGVAIVATSLAHGAGPTSARLIIGVLFVAVGAARLYLTTRAPHA
jgi:hypothetical protein